MRKLIEIIYLHSRFMSMLLFFLFVSMYLQLQVYGKFLYLLMFFSLIYSNMLQIVQMPK